MDELAALRVFTRVVQLGSFSKVARHLDTATSSVARHIDALEDELGLRLFNRTTRQLVLTEAGERFYQDAARIVQSMDDAKRNATAFQEGVRGAIRVHASPTVGTTIIIPALPTFLAQHPELTVDLSLTDKRVDLVAERVDVAIWRGHIDDSSRLVARLLGTQRLVVCASPAYLERHGRPTTPEDLLQHNCLVFSAPHYLAEWAFETDGSTKRVPVSGNLKVDTGAGLITAVLGGLGVTIMPEWVVRELCARGTLEIVLADYEVSPTGIDTSLHLVYPHHSPPPKVAAFIEFVRALFQGGNTVGASRPGNKAQE
jgi:DNA-binding transcriptional LysR family regulator